MSYNETFPLRPNRIFQLLLTLLLVCATLPSAAQVDEAAAQQMGDIDMDSPTFRPTIHTGKTLVGRDSVPYVKTNNVYVFPKIEFKTPEERAKFYRLLYNIKKVLPIAKECRQIVVETYEYMQTLPTEQARKEHMKRVEREIKATYGPRMKKLTYSQGKLLIKLVDRETHSSGYELINAFLGPVRAGFYQAFAWVFGASLKKRYDPTGADRLTERIVLQVEAGQL